MQQATKRIKIIPNFNFLQTNIASPNQLKNWSERFFYQDNFVLGEVHTIPANLYYKNFMIAGGLFCRQIFGPVNNLTCACGAYTKYLKKKIPKNVLYCNKCRVELTHPSIRTFTLGYLKLALPVINPFLYKNNYLKLLLNLKFPNMSVNDVHNAIYYTDLISEYFLDHLKRFKSEFFSANIQPFTKNLNESTYKEIEINDEPYGIEILNNILETICIQKEIRAIRNFNKDKLDTKKLLQLRLLESFAGSMTRPEWIIFKILPIIGPTFRPFKRTEKKAELSLNLNELYIQISDLNYTLFQGFSQETNLDRMQLAQNFQLAIDNLFVYQKANENEEKSEINNNSRRGLTDFMEGKTGQFRSQILGKRVDYSGRSTIVSGPNLKINQCGLPYSIATKIFEPILVKQIYNSKKFQFLKKKEIVEIFFKKKKLLVWPLLSKIITQEAIILNRAPTLHKNSIHSFNPILTLNLAIYLHPMLCAAFNADFDGDQIAINISLLTSSKIEALAITKPITNLMSSANLSRIIKPNQEIVLGCYYSTIFQNTHLKLPLKTFSNFSEVLSAFLFKSISLQQPILVKVMNKSYFFKDFNVNLNGKLIEKKFILKKFYYSNNNLYLLSDLGFIVSSKLKTNIYKANKVFVKTTAGQIFYQNLLNN